MCVCVLCVVWCMYTSRNASPVWNSTCAQHNTTAVANSTLPILCQPLPISSSYHTQAHGRHRSSLLRNKPRHPQSCQEKCPLSGLHEIKFSNYRGGVLSDVDKNPSKFTVENFNFHIQMRFEFDEASVKLCLCICGLISEEKPLPTPCQFNTKIISSCSPWERWQVRLWDDGQYVHIQVHRSCHASCDKSRNTLCNRHLVLNQLCRAHHQAALNTKVLEPLDPKSSVSHHFSHVEVSQFN